MGRVSARSVRTVSRRIVAVWFLPSLETGTAYFFAICATVFFVHIVGCGLRCADCAEPEGGDGALTVSVAFCAMCEREKQNETNVDYLRVDEPRVMVGRDREIERRQTRLHRRQTTLATRQTVDSHADARYICSRIAYEFELEDYNDYEIITTLVRPQTRVYHSTRNFPSGKRASQPTTPNLGIKPPKFSTDVANKAV